MKARVFLDAFAECVVNVAIARRFPDTVTSMRNLSVSVIAVLYGDSHAEATGAMFDRLWHDLHNPGTKQ